MADSDELLCVAPHDVEAVWQHVSPRIEDALARGNSRLTTAQVKARLKDGKLLMWLAATDKEIFGVMITEVSIDGDGIRICTIIALSAKSFKRCWKFSKDIYQYARDEGCERIRLYGRYGWERVLRDDGYRPLFALEKVL